MKKLFLLLCHFLLLQFAVSQNSITLDWAGLISGPGHEFAGNSVDIDASGNLYLAGSFSDTADFDLGPGIVSMVPNGWGDIFIEKMDSNGNLIWLKHLGGIGVDEVHELEIDHSGNVVIWGEFQDSVDFDPGPGSLIFEAWGTDAFLLKLSGNGDLIWAKQFRDSLRSVPRGGTISTNNEILTTGIFAGTVDLDPGPGSFYLNSVGQWDCFVSRHDSNGNIIWANGFGGRWWDMAEDITTDLDGNIFVTGYVQDSVDMDPGLGTSMIYVRGEEAFVQKLRSDGSFVWAKLTSSLFANNTGYLVLTDSAGSVYVGGLFTDTVDFDPGPGSLLIGAYTGDGFIWKLDSVGNLEWANSVNGLGSGDSQLLAMCKDKHENLLLTGLFSGPIDFYMGPPQLILQPVGDLDVFLLSISKAGSFNWVKSFGGAGQDVGEGVLADDADNVYVVGTIMDVADMDPGPDSLMLIPAGSFDIFFTKFNACGPTSSFIYADSACDSYTFGNQTFFQSGQYLQVLPGSNGCDSIVTLNLSILSANAGVWMDNGELHAYPFNGTYQWFNCNNLSVPIAGATGLSFTPPVDGSYAVQVTANGCTGMSTCIDYSLTSFPEPSDDDRLKVYPNPSTGTVFVDLSEYHYECIVRVWNSFGQICHEQTFNPGGVYPITLGEAAGMYTIEIAGKVERVYKKIIINPN